MRALKPEEQRFATVYSAAEAKLRDWPLLEEFYNRFYVGNKFMEARLDCDLETIEGFFHYGLYAPRQFAVMVVKSAMPSPVSVFHPIVRIVGMALLMEVSSPYKLKMLPRTFIHGIFIPPGQPKEVGKALMPAMQRWGRERGHDLLWGNIRLPHGANARNGFKVRAVQKQYGFRVEHMVLVADTKEAVDGQNPTPAADIVGEPDNSPGSGDGCFDASSECAHQPRAGELCDGPAWGGCGSGVEQSDVVPITATG
jgi:GNAT superfamily N-acetyltransferase